LTHVWHSNFLLKASLLYKDESSLGQKSSNLSQNTSVCPYCHQWLQPDNHRIRLRPKQHPSARVQRILQRRARGKRLNFVQRNLLYRFQKSSSVLMVTCHTCNMTSRHKGRNREFTASFTKTHSTPWSAGKHKTPPSTKRVNATPKTPGRDKTPVHTPRSTTSSSTPGSGSSSSKSASKTKNWVGQRLSKILMREDTQGNKKGGLKDFLSSL
uniref:CR021 protein n=1 Tax=Mola mola TaxID=94237 RepID=A0A3Q3XNM9_MOLML